MIAGVGSLDTAIKQRSREKVRLKRNDFTMMLIPDCDTEALGRLMPLPNKDTLVRVPAVPIRAARGLKAFTEVVSSPVNA
jgi:hypothetical protein